MKVIKIFAVVAALFCRTFVSAQFQKGSKSIGISLYTESSKVKDDSIGNTTSSFNPVVIECGYSWFYKENKSLGVQLLYVPSKSMYLSKGDSTNQFQKMYGIGVFHRSHKKLSKDLYLFTEASVNYQYSIVTTYDYYTPSTGYKRTEKANTANGQISLGILYQLYKHLQLEIALPSIFNIGYTAQKTNISEIGGGANYAQTATDFTISSPLTNQSLLGNLVVGLKINL
jgi:hypothetical protein